MSDVQLFRISKEKVSEIEGRAVSLEKKLQTLFEKNLETLFGVRFIGTEVPTGAAHRGRIDTLGLDENDCPVIIEYKRRADETVINQGLYYLDWLADHHGDFELLVRERLQRNAPSDLNWRNSRLICVAADYSKYDTHAVRQIRRNIDLVRYVSFDDDLMLIELVHRTFAELEDPPERRRPPRDSSAFTRGIKSALGALDPEMRKLFNDTSAFLNGLGDDVTVRKQKFYWAFSRLKNFACLEVRKAKLVVYLSLNPAKTKLVSDFTRDMRGVGHWGTGDLQVNISTPADLQRAKDLMVRAYEGH